MIDEAGAPPQPPAHDATVASRVALPTLGIIVSTAVVALAGGTVLGNATAFAFSVIMLPFPVVGAIVASRRPVNPIGWIMLAIGGMAALDGALRVYADVGLRDAVPLPGATVA